MGSWQPIETAPKDGTIVLLFKRMDPWNVVGYGHWVGGQSFVSGWVTDGFHDPPGNLGLATPSHWMPLPKPPCSEKETPAARCPDGGEHVLNDVTGDCVRCGN